MNDDGGKIMANGVGRKAIRPARSHEDIYDAVEALRDRVEATVRQAGKATHDVDLYTMAVQGLQKEFGEVKRSVETLAAMVGATGTDDRGMPIGTGLAGSLQRLAHNVNERFRVYDRWRFIAFGFMAACAVFGPIIWWLLNDRLGALLKPH